MARVEPPSNELTAVAPHVSRGGSFCCMRVRLGVRPETDFRDFLGLEHHLSDLVTLYVFRSVSQYLGHSSVSDFPAVFSFSRHFF